MLREPLNDLRGINANIKFYTYTLRKVSLYIFIDLRVTQKREREKKNHKKHN